ncbi:MAG: hypothetical protein WC891_08645 [Actinomycetota bacterium]
MSETSVIINETDQGFMDQDGNSYCLISRKHVEEFHAIIQALNEALVECAARISADYCVCGGHEKPDKEDPDLIRASKALSLVPEADRKGGTWRFEE